LSRRKRKREKLAVLRLKKCTFLLDNVHRIIVGTVARLRKGITRTEQKGEKEKPGEGKKLLLH